MAVGNPASAQKSGKIQVSPIVPEFAKPLDTVPTDERTGPVFDVGTSRCVVGRIVSAIGKAAGVVVNDESKKTASAHDLRRSFGDRWSRKVMPAVLKELMRHANITTTMGYYVTDDAERTAAELWQADSGLGVRQGDRTESTEGEVSENL